VRLLERKGWGRRTADVRKVMGKSSKEGIGLRCEDLIVKLILSGVTAEAIFALDCEEMLWIALW